MLPEFRRVHRVFSCRVPRPEFTELTVVDDPVREYPAFPDPDDEDGRTGAGIDRVNGKVDPGLHPPADDLIQSSSLHRHRNGHTWDGGWMPFASSMPMMRSPPIVLANEEASLRSSFFSGSFLHTNPACSRGSCPRG